MVKGPISTTPNINPRTELGSALVTTWGVALRAPIRMGNWLLRGAAEVAAWLLSEAGSACVESPGSEQTDAALATSGDGTQSRGHRRAQARRGVAVGYWEWDMRRNELLWSAEAYRIFGLDRRGFDLTYHSFLSFVHPEDRARVRRTIEAPRSGTERLDVEYRLIRPDGRERVLHTVGQPKVGPSERVTGAAGMVYDVTGDEAAETEPRLLLEATAAVTGDAFFRLLVRTVAAALQVRFAFVAEIMDDAGTTARTVALWMDGCHGENVEYPLRGTPCEYVVRRRTVCCYPERLQERFPESCWLARLGAESYLGVPLVAASGAVIGQVAIADGGPLRDAARTASLLEVCAGRAGAELERSRTTRVLQERARRLGVLLETAPIGIASADAHGVLREVNPAFAQLLGYRPEELREKTLELITHPGDVESSLELLRELGDRERDVAGTEQRYQRRDGSIMWGQLTAAAVRDDQGGLQYVVLVLEDVTGRKAAAADLQEARDRALDAAQVQAELLASTSHEMRTAANAIVGGLALLSESALTAEQRAIAEVMQSSASAQLSLVSDILDYTRMGAGGLRIEPRPFDLRRIVDEVLQLVQGDAARKNLDLRVQYADEIPQYLIGDAERIRQVLTNLVANAVKFTDRGHVGVCVMQQEQGDEGVLLRVAVEDTGIGIPENLHQWIFERFAQAEPVGGRRCAGVGLGLAICKQLIELMGGTISVSSHPEQGSTFCFMLRLPVGTPPALPDLGHWSAGATAGAGAGEHSEPRACPGEDSAMNGRSAAGLGLRGRQ